MILSGVQSSKTHSPVEWIILIASLALYIVAGYLISRKDFIVLISLYLVLFATYIYLSRRYSSTNELKDLRIIIGAAILYRLSFLFSTPTLSDDFFRFLWDGMLSSHGINPYLVTPSDLIKDPENQSTYSTALVSGMNSKDYYTVYPPICQFIFAGSASLFPGNLLGSIVALRVSCIAADLGTLYFLDRLIKHFSLPKGSILFYALNPLVIIELAGNIHFEAIMIFFLVLALYFLIKSVEVNQALKPQLNSKFILSALSFSASISTKLLPLIFLPFLIKRLGWKRSLIYFTLILVSLLLFFFPFLDKELVLRMQSSLGLYFQKFEFNASVFYIVRWLGFLVKGYDIILKATPWLALATFIIIIILVFVEKNRSWNTLFLGFQWSLTCYLLLATTVHPWYIIPFLLFSIFTGYRYAIVWSLVIFLTYATFQRNPYHENLLFTAFEYMLVIAVMVYEIYHRQKQNR